MSLTICSEHKKEEPMAQVIDFRSVREIGLSPTQNQKLSCARCGADTWTILTGGQVCCADCEEACPLHINFTNENKQ